MAGAETRTPGPVLQPSPELAQKLSQDAASYWTRGRKLRDHLREHGREFWPSMTNEEYTAIGLEVRHDPASLTQRFFDRDAQLIRRGYYDMRRNIFVSVNNDDPNLLHTIFRPRDGRQYWDQLLPVP